MLFLLSRLSGEISLKSTVVKLHLSHLTQFSTRFWECTRYFQARIGLVSSTWLPTSNRNIMLDGSRLYFLSGGSFWVTVGSEIFGIGIESADMKKVIVLNMFIAVVQENFDVTEDEKRERQLKTFLQNKDYSAPTQG